MKKLFCLLFICAVSRAPCAHAAFGDAPAKAPEAENVNPLIASAHLQPSTIEAGGTANLTVDLELPGNYHAYLERFKLVIESPDDLKLGSFKIAPVVSFADKVTGQTKKGVSGKAKLKALIEIPTGFSTGAERLQLKLTYQACTEDHCLFPKTVSLETPFRVR
jgi:thiol:disulfide interchange protein DsbD